MSTTADKKQLLRDPDIAPTSEAIAAGLGSANDAYVKFVKELESNYGITLMDWRYYNDGKAWLSKGEYKWVTSRGTNKVKPLFWLSIWEGFFKVSFFFSTGLQDELAALPISQNARDIIQNTDPMGKTARFIAVIIDIESDSQLNDVYALAEFRKVKVK
jgi:hypothetical protein